MTSPPSWATRTSELSPRLAASSRNRKGFKEGDLVFVEHYVSCGKCEWCHAGQYRHCENTNWRTNPDAIRYGYTSDEKPPHLWGGFAQYVYLPWNAVVHHVPKGVTPELAGLVTPMANGVEWSLFDGGVGYNSTVLIQGPGQQGLSQTVICKQAGASLIIVTGTSKDAARLKVAKELGADYVIDVNKEDPLARIKEITGGKGVDVSLDCTAGAGTIPILLGIEALKRKAGIIVAQGEMSAFPNFPLEKFTVKFITMKSARGHSYTRLRARFGADRVKALPSGEDHHAPVRIEGRRPRDPLGRRQGRAGRDPRLADAVEQLNVARAARHGAVPDLVAVLIEDQPQVRGRGVPGIHLEFVFQLARSPTGIAKRHDRFVRPFVSGNVAQHLAARCHREAPVDAYRFGTLVFGAVQDEAALRLDRAARENAHIALCACRCFTKHFEDLRHGTLVDRPVDDDAERAGVVVPHHQNDGAGEAWIAHRRGGNQHLPGQ